jgi:hypothetical protein
MTGPEQPHDFLSPSIRVTYLDGEAVLLDLASQRYYEANPTASAILAALHAGTGREGAIDRLVGAFEVDRADATISVDAFINELRTAGLLVPATPQ